MQDVKGACENGTTCTFLMNDGNKIPVALSNIEENKRLVFSGGMFGGLLSFEGKVLISSVDASNSKIDYRLVRYYRLPTISSISAVILIPCDTLCHILLPTMAALH
jgi:hypothetical protein